MRTVERGSNCEGFPLLESDGASTSLPADTQGFIDDHSIAQVIVIGGADAVPVAFHGCTHCPRHQGRAHPGTSRQATRGRGGHVRVPTPPVRHREPFGSIDPTVRCRWRGVTLHRCARARALRGLVGEPILLTIDPFTVGATTDAFLAAVADDFHGASGGATAAARILVITIDHRGRHIAHLLWCGGRSARRARLAQASPGFVPLSAETTLATLCPLLDRSPRRASASTPPPKGKRGAKPTTPPPRTEEPTWVDLHGDRLCAAAAGLISAGPVHRHVLEQRAVRRQRGDGRWREVPRHRARARLRLLHRRRKAVHPHRAVRSLAFRVDLFSAVCTVAAVVITYWVGRRSVAGQSVRSSVPSRWHRSVGVVLYATYAKAYGFTVLLLALILCCWSRGVRTVARGGCTSPLRSWASGPGGRRTRSCCCRFPGYCSWCSAKSAPTRGQLLAARASPWPRRVPSSPMSSCEPVNTLRQLGRRHVGVAPQRDLFQMKDFGFGRRRSVGPAGRSPGSRPRGRPGSGM